MPLRHLRQRPLRQRPLVTQRGALDEVRQQQRDILTPLIEARQVDADHADAVIQVFAKTALRAHLQQVGLAGGDDAAIDGDRLVAAETLQFPLLQHAQQFHLQGQRHAFDFVEEHRAALGVFELADAPFLGAGESSCLMAENLAFEYGFRQRAAIDGDKRSFAAAGDVQLARHHFLAAAGLAVDQDVDHGRPDAADHGADLFDRGRLPDQARHVRMRHPGRLEAPVLQDQAALFLRPVGGFHQPLGGERLFDEVVGAGAHGVDRHADVAMAGHHNHRQVGIQRHDLGQQFQAGTSRQPHVGDNHAGKTRAQPGLRLFHAIAGMDGKPAQFQRLRNRFPHCLFILDQYCFQRCHPCLHQDSTVSSKGMRNTNSAPPSLWLFAVRRPFIACTMDDEMARPRPNPLPDGLVVKNGSNRCKATWAGIPGPESRMRITASPPSHSSTRETVFCSALSTASSALRNRLISTCSVRTESPTTRAAWRISICRLAPWVWNSLCSNKAAASIDFDKSMAATASWLFLEKPLSCPTILPMRPLALLIWPRFSVALSACPRVRKVMALSANARIAASGWFSSWAMPAAIWPSMASLPAWISLFWVERSRCSVSCSLAYFASRV
ncbi:hypothetical protein CFU_2252 [Collimonas fungivorans Ter331]|uniref:Uncharacterized protein n=1 Tax=Collimonas fungivorans (strain Ter331) TaxID=1005048 RepID=G0AKF2_COLFT|nr:hypothetical protein CFU_2252 [Collimonas fungivorans Ter331]